ncbi:MAG: IS66 family transposase [Myxococcota bacterium]
MALAKKMRTFKTTEKVSDAQLLLFLEKAAEDHPAVPPEPPNKDEPPRPPTLNEELKKLVDEERKRRSTEKTKPPPRRPRKKPFPDALKRVDNIIPVPHEQRPCPKCGAERRCLGHEVSEVLELEPAKVFVRRDRRETLTCDTCETPQITRAPRGDRVVEGGRFGLRIVAQMLVDKFRDGLPLQRQRERYRRLGVDLSVSTLADQIGWGAELLKPLWRALQREALRADILHLDATGLPFFDQVTKGGKKRKKIGALWGYVGDDATALYLFAPSGHATFEDRNIIGPADFLGLRTGLTVADAASVFDKAFERDDIIECGCNIHARRYFGRALDNGDARAAIAIAAYKALYKIEDEARDLTPSERLIIRQQRSAPIFMKMVEWAESIKDAEPPASKLGRALTYLTNQQEPLGRFLKDGRIPPDNNVVERLHVRAALTRKNFLWAGSHRGAISASIAFSIIGTCILCDIEPLEYLSTVMPILVRGVIEKDVGRLLPQYLT